MTGDLIRAYERIGNDMDGGRASSFTGLTSGLMALAKRWERKFNPDAAARTDMTDAIESVSEFASGEDKFEIWRGVTRGMRVCESPIEKLLLPWLLAQKYTGFTYRPRMLLSGDGYLLNDMCVAVVPQLQIGRRRADLALAAKRGKHMKFVVVECDGAAFHDGVENVMRDVSRDVEILKSKKILSVIRFTGSEIHKSPRTCASQAAQELYRCWLKGNPETDYKFAGDAA